jgi:hypothetical protein
MVRFSVETRDFSTLQSVVQPCSVVHPLIFKYSRTLYVREYSGRDVKLNTQLNLMARLNEAMQALSYLPSWRAEDFTSFVLPRNSHRCVLKEAAG